MNKRWSQKWRDTLHKIIYEADTPAGKRFDIALLIFILVSILLVMLESVKEVDARFHYHLLFCEWVVTIFFSIEYIARIVTVKKPWRYIFSFYGLVDFFSTIPLYVSYFLAGSQALLAFRAFRLLRIFRIFKLVRYWGEATYLRRALIASRTKILVFLYGVIIACVILGTIMYLIESDEAGFTSIPRSIYWTIVTLTTVGYGDIAPQTPLGQIVASVVMIIGYGIIAVPTGIVTAEMSSSRKKKHTNTLSCASCLNENHTDGATFCHHCGYKLHE